MVSIVKNIATQTVLNCVELKINNITYLKYFKELHGIKLFLYLFVLILKYIKNPLRPEIIIRSIFTRQ